MTKIETRDTPLLNWDVYVTPGIPVVVKDLPPGMKQRVFSPISSTLISGLRAAVLVNAFTTIDQTKALLNWVASSGKNLTTIYITHGHGDHWFGIGSLLECFPNARAVAVPDVVKMMRDQSSQKFLESFWKSRFPGQIPDKVVKSSMEAELNLKERN